MYRGVHATMYWGVTRDRVRGGYVPCKGAVRARYGGSQAPLVGEVGVQSGLVALNHWWQNRHPHATEGGHVQVLGSFGDTACHMKIAALYTPWCPMRKSLS